MFQSKVSKPKINEISMRKVNDIKIIDDGKYLKIFYKKPRKLYVNGIEITTFNR